MKRKVTNSELIFLAIVVVPSALIDGLVLSCFWSWFVMPVFEAAPQVTYLQAIGLYMFKAVILPTKPLDEDEPIGAQWLGAVFSRLLLWGFGYIAYLLIY